MLGKILILLLALCAYVQMASAVCADIHQEGHCKVFQPFCSDPQYKSIRDKCAKSCGDCK